MLLADLAKGLQKHKGLHVCGAAFPTGLQGSVGMGAAAQGEQAAGLGLARSSPQTKGREWVLDAQFWPGGQNQEYLSQAHPPE